MVDLAVGIQITDVAEDLRGHAVCLGAGTDELDVQRNVIFGAGRELYDLTHIGPNLAFSRSDAPYIAHLLIFVNFDGAVGFAGCKSVGSRQILGIAVFKKNAL